jgi:alanyl-tRNA synthetase
VNEAIEKKCAMTVEQMSKEAAKAAGIEGSFWEKYPETVDVYMAKSGEGTVYSAELCGGPHVKNTGDIKGTFRIVKEEASSSGVRRIKAVIE